MWMQTVNKADVEKVWVNFTNADGQTISLHHPVVKFMKMASASSVTVNDAASRPVIYGGGACGGGSFIGLADEDVAAGDIGIAQVYGYHESVLVFGTDGDKTVNPGAPLGVRGFGASIGLNSIGAVSPIGPVVALETIGATMLSVGAAGATAYANHVFIRAL